MSLLPQTLLSISATWFCLVHSDRSKRCFPASPGLVLTFSRDCESLKYSFSILVSEPSRFSWVEAEPPSGVDGLGERTRQPKARLIGDRFSSSLGSGIIAVLRGQGEEVKDRAYRLLLLHFRYPGKPKEELGGRRCQLACAPPETPRNLILEKMVCEGEVQSTQ
jgi:hypothetical protein